MAGAFVSSASADIGASYTPGSGSDTIAIMIGGSIGAGTTTHSNQTLGGTSMTEAANQDQSIDLTGNGDPSGFLAHLVNPGTSALTTAVTYSSGRAQDNGRALTLSGINQTTPVYPTNGSQAGTYTGSGTTEPSLGYDAPVDSVVVYWRIHARGGGAISYTAPSGFTLAGIADIITSPARRQLGVWYKAVSSAEVAATVQASELSNGDGVHGVVVFQAPAGGSTTFKTVTATHTGTASLSKVVIYVRTHTATHTATASISRTNTFARTLTATHTASASLSRFSEFFRTFSATHTASASVSAFSEFFRTFTATATHTSSMAKGIVLSVLSAATHTATASVSSLSVLGLTFSATANHTASVVKKIFKSFSATHTSTPDVTKQVGKTLTATNVSTASEAHISVLSVTSNATHTGTASSSQAFTAGTPTFSFIKGVLITGIAMIGKLIKGNKV